MFCHGILNTRIPWVHVRGQQATRSHRRSRANSFSLGCTEKVTKNPSLSKWNLFPGLYLYFYVLTIILNFSFKVYKSFLICKTVSKHAVIYAPNSLCSTKTNQPRLQGFSVTCPVFWQLCCRTTLGSRGFFFSYRYWSRVFFSSALCASLTRLRREPSVSIRKKYPLEPRVL